MVNFYANAVNRSCLSVLGSLTSKSCQELGSLVINCHSGVVPKSLSSSFESEGHPNVTHHISTTDVWSADECVGHEYMSLCLDCLVLDCIHCHLHHKSHNTKPFNDTMSLFRGKLRCVVGQLKLTTSLHNFKTLLCTYVCCHFCVILGFGLDCPLDSVSAKKSDFHRLK